ncbi:hypothetical protein [Duganella fentianensis]|uniref:hypothetical protein n=1 Tax=Duganella fentianensis TaxID=2692177 RepID=UPI0032B1DDE4
MAKTATLLQHKSAATDLADVTAGAEEHEAAHQFIEQLAEQALDRRALLEKLGLIIPVEELASRSGLSPEKIWAACAKGRLFTLETRDGRKLFPSFFANPALPGEELEAISTQLTNVSDSGKWQFFTTPKLSLRGQTPLEAIALGEFERVRISAAGFAGR